MDKFGKEFVWPFTPRTLRPRIMKKLHFTRIGIIKMKLLTQSYVQWPGVDAVIENTAKEYTTGCKNCNNPKKVPVHPWDYDYTSRRSLLWLLISEAEKYYAQTIKKNLRNQLIKSEEFKLSLHRFLMQCGNMPNIITQTSPAEFMFQCNI